MHNCAYLRRQIRSYDKRGYNTAAFILALGVYIKPLVDNWPLLSIRLKQSVIINDQAWNMGRYENSRVV